MNHYNRIRQATVKAYPKKLPEFHTEKAKEIYEVVKKENDIEAKEKIFQEEIKKLSLLSIKQKSENMLYFIKANQIALERKSDLSSKQKTLIGTTDNSGTNSVVNEQHDGQNPIAIVETNKRMGNPARAQMEAKADLDRSANIVAEMATFLNKNDPEFQKAVKDRDMARKRLKNLQLNAKRQKNFQLNRKRKLQEICTENEAVRKKLRLNQKCGRSSETDCQPGLLEAIKEISLRGAGAHERRRAETLNSCRTLDELTRELKTLGFNLSRSGVYLRLIPRNWKTTEGKRHITRANVKLKRAENEEHRQHPDAKFAKATFDSLMTLASTLGPYDVACLSQDDKAKVPLGLPAANKQSTILMNLEYRVKLPDHDFVIASGHKLTPSVIAGLDISSSKLLNGSVSYSGPTYIGIRSGKHDSSVAATHAADLRYLYDNVAEFRSILYRADGTKKPILIIFVDGGPDENPRYRETIRYSCSNFCKFNLDALYIATQAPGRSAYNPVERRMAPLSRFLAGIILPHDTFGSHLNSQGVTVDEELEKQNFQKAGETLAEVWREAVIDQFPVVAEWRGGIVAEEPATVTEEWLANHVRASQYFLQITKCQNEECCAPLRSSLRSVLPNGFLPAPLAVLNSVGLAVASGEENESAFLSLFHRLSIKLSHSDWTKSADAPYDIACPTVKNEIAKRTCNICHLYFPSQVMTTSHKKAMHPRVKHNEPPKVRPKRIAAIRQRELMAIIVSGEMEDAEWLNEEEVDSSGLERPLPSNSRGLPFVDIQNNPWEED